jgi:protein-S-isoprenylcysteine O-methyltransferase Ste14
VFHGSDEEVGTVEFDVAGLEARIAEAEPAYLVQNEDMTNWTLRVIGYTWVVWLVYWTAMAFTAKRTIERSNGIWYRLIFAAGLIGLISLNPLSSKLALNSHLWQTTTALGVLTDCIVLAGFAFTVWARITLGRNWSGDVAFKQDHELIESGPYSLVRHPIYTGLILMALGTAINYGQAIGFVLFVVLCIGAWLKFRQEEQLMIKHFPEDYAEYKQRVHALIPFVL